MNLNSKILILTFLKIDCLKAGLYDEIFLSRPWNFYFKRKVSKYFRKRNVCREILFSLFTQSSFIHTIMIAFHSQRLTVFIFLVIDIIVLNVWKYWKSPHNYVALGLKARKSKVLLHSYFSKIFQNYSVNAQCLSEAEGTPT